MPPARAQPRRRHAAPTSSRARGGLGRARPRQPRAGRPRPRGARRHRFLRAGDLALPRRPDADRRTGPGLAARARAARRHVAGHRGGRRPLRAADRPGRRVHRRRGHRRRPVGRHARRRSARSRPSTGSRTSRTEELRWPPGDGDLAPFAADVALIAHVGYDIEAIGPFVAAMEAAARRLCVAVLMERQPSSIADVCWPPVYERAAGPAAGAAGVRGTPAGTWPRTIGGAAGARAAPFPFAHATWRGSCAASCGWRRGAPRIGASSRPSSRCS